MSFRVFHVEDSDLQAYMVESTLNKAFKDEDYIYVRTKGLQETLGQLDQGCLDVVVVDLGLPDARGTEAVEAIRGVCPEAPILVLTGEDAFDVGKSCVRAGADYYLTKNEVRSLPIAIIAAVERWELRRERKAVQDRYASIVEESPDWIIRFTPSSIITFANKAVLNAYRMTLDDVLGKSLYDLMDADQRRGHEEVVALLTPESPHVDGNDLWLAGRLIHWRKSGIFSKQGRLVEVQAIGRDITAEYEMLQQLKYDAAKLVSKATEKADALLDNAVAKLNETIKTMGQADG